MRDRGTVLGLGRHPWPHDVDLAEVDEVPPAVRPLVSATLDGSDPTAAMAAAVRALGFEWFNFLQVQRGGQDAESRTVLWSNFPEAWASTYHDCTFIAIDPRVPAAMRSAVPEIWDRSIYPDTPELRAFFDTAAAFGLQSGVFIVVNQPNPGSVVFFAVASSQRADTPARRGAIARATGDLWALGAYGHRLLANSRRDLTTGQGDGRRLSGRELECLALSARGATSLAIASRLGISARTVNAHLERAMRKCGARNRQEAVARSISAGLISL